MSTRLLRSQRSGLKTPLMPREVSSSIPGPTKSDTLSLTACHCCNISSKLCSTGDKPRKYALACYTLRRNTVSIMKIMHWPWVQTPAKLLYITLRRHDMTVISLILSIFFIINLPIIMSLLSNILYLYTSNFSFIFALQLKDWV